MKLSAVRARLGDAFSEASAFSCRGPAVFFHNGSVLKPERERIRRPHPARTSYRRALVMEIFVNILETMTSDVAVVGWTHLATCTRAALHRPDSGRSVSIPATLASFLGSMLPSVIVVSRLDHFAVLNHEVRRAGRMTCTGMPTFFANDRDVVTGGSAPCLHWRR